jgi:hypothetical protein
MITIHLFLAILGLVLILLAAFNVSHPRAHFGWLGVFLWLLSTLLR